MIGVNKGIQRTLVILTSLFCLMTSMIRVHAVDSIDDTGTLRYENCINSVDGGYIWKYLESTSSNCIAPRFMVDDAVAYCLEPQVPADPGTTYNASDPSAFEWPSLQAKNRIMLIAYFAYGYKGDYSDERYLGGWYLVWRQMGEFFMHQFSTHNGDMGSYNYAIEAKMAEIDQLVDAYLRKPLFKVENLNSGTVFDSITDNGTVFASRGDTLRFTAVDHTLDGYTVSVDGGGTIVRQAGDIIEVKVESEGTPRLHFAKVGDDPQVTVQTFVLKARDEQTMVTRGMPEPMYADITIDVQGPVRFLKKDLETGEGVEGAVLRFYDEEWNFIDEIVSEKTPVSLNTDKFIRNKAYFIVETKAPKDYEIIEAPNPNWYGTWSKPEKDRQGNAIEGTVVDITWLGTNLMETISVSNKRKTQLHIRKSNAAGSPLAGAVLALYDGSTKVAEWTTKTDEEYHALDVESGKTYTVKETTVPEGYVRPKDASVTIKGNDTEVTIRNVKVSALKTDCEGNPLSGAKMEVRDDQNKLVDSWSSTLKAHDICNLEEGRVYTLIETQAPKGFLVGDPVTFTPGTEDQVIRFVDDSSIILRIRKADSAGNPVAGAKLQLLDGTEVIDSWTTSENEDAHTVEVEKGKTYTVHEETAPKDYVKARDVNVTIKDEITDVTMTDIQVKFLKLDKDGSPLAGARIQVTDPDGRPIDEWTTDTTPHVIVGLCEGVTYTAYETKAPVGYELAEPITFTPEQGDLFITMTDDDENDLEIVKVDASGNGVKGAKLQLLDGDTVVDEWISDGTEMPHSVKGIAAGKTYTVHEQEAPAGYVRMKDIVITASTGITKITLRNYRISVKKTDGTGVMLAKARLQVINESGTVVDEWETDGSAHDVSGLEEGKTYILKEAKAPLGYTTADEITFTPAQKDITFTMVDEIQDLQIAKKDTEGNTVTGALLRLLDGDQVIDEWETGTQEYHAVSDITIGRTYTIHEERVPEGYVRAKDIVFTMKAGVNTFVMQDFRISALKTDENGSPLAGAKLAVKDASGNVIDSWESGSEPHFINNLNEGETYTLIEKEAPFGYFVADPVTFTAEAGTTTIIMADEPQNIYVYVEKQDAVTHLPLAGAEFTVYRKADGEIAEDINGNKAVVLSDENGRAEICLPWNTASREGYLLKETAAPAGYENSCVDIVYEIVPDETYSFTAGSETFRFLFEDRPATLLRLKKTDALNADRPLGEAQLKGAEYTLYDEQGREVHTFVFDEAGHTEELRHLRADQIYTLKETKAPAGYCKDETVYEIDFAEAEMKDGMLVIDRTLKEEIYRGSFRIFKVRSVQNNSELASPEEGAVFTAILKKYADQYGSFEEALNHKEEFNEFEYDEITTDAEGIAESKQLVYGTYVVRQTGATAETQLLDEAFTFTVDSPHQKTIDYRIINRANPYRLRIVKTDAGTGEPVIWHAAEFKVFALTDSQGREVNAYVTQTVGSRTYDTFKTTALEPGSAESGVLYVMDGENGEVTLPLEIEAGTYRIEEVKAPQGYRLLKEPIIVEIGHSSVSQADTDGTPLFTVTAENERIEGSLQVRKNVTLPEADTILVEPEDLSGIVFTVSAAEDIHDAATGEVIVKKGDVIHTLTTETDGSARADRLPPARYYVQETQASDGLLVNQEIHEIVLDAGETEELEYQLDVTDHVTLTEISKTDITGQKELPGARLQVSDDQGNVVDEWTSADQPHRIAGLKAGAVYHLRETIAPDGYVRSEEITFTIAETGEVQKVQMTDKTVTMSKEDVYGRELPGAHMKVFDEEGNVVDEWISGTAAHMIKGLQEGKSYILHEDTAPAGYALAQDLPFTVTSEKKDQVLTLTDQMVTVSKQDVSGAEIEGALMRVYDSSGRIVDEWISTKTPHAIENLICGNSYVIHEELTPYVTETDEEGNEVRIDLGYVKATDIPFTLQADGKNTHYVMTDSTVTVDKRDLGGEEVEGTLLQVLAEDGTVVDEWISGKEPHRVLNLEAGHTYTLHEEGAPQGYYYAADAEFTVTEEGVDMEMTMIDAPVVYDICKIDDKEGLIVAGVTLTLYDVTEEGQRDQIGQWKTTAEPIRLEGILEAEHSYELEETEIVAGVYQAASVLFTVPREGTGEPVTVTMVDETTAVSIMKTDESGQPLAGALMQIVDRNGKVIYQFTSSDDPHGHDISPYVKGGETYILHEVSAPYGYTVFDDLRFEINGRLEQAQIITAMDRKQHFTLELVKAETGRHDHHLSGAEFSVFRNADHSLAKDIQGLDCRGVTGSDGILRFELPYDAEGYYVQETKAPQGYILSGVYRPVEMSVDFVFEMNEPIVMLVENEPVTITRTGDEGIRGPLFTMGVSLACMIMLIILRRRHGT